MTAMVAAVETEDLSYRDNGTAAIDGLSLRIAEGEFFALLGPNGAGKSTLLHMLTTLLPPSEGRASVKGHDVVREAEQVRRTLGMVFQEPALDDRLNGYENLDIHAVLYGIRRADRRTAVQQALEWASLGEAGRRPVRTYSGGMKRRLELARALMHRPAVLFLDEPTLGLDPQGRRDLWERIATLREGGMTVLMTTHYLAEAEACDRVGIIDRGKLIAVGEPAVLKAGDGQEPAATLEEVFIRLTGRQLIDEPSTARDRLLSFARRGGELTR
jgi:ABC-2 type transport system ATP-binding protein